MKYKYMAMALFAAWFMMSCSACKKSTTDTGNNLPVDSTRIVKSGLSHPWEITWGPDNFIWITERSGRVQRIDPATGNSSFSFTISEVEANGEGGLLGMALHPDFMNNGYLYVVYNYDNSGSYREKLVRYTYSGNTLTSAVTILDGITAAGIHNGARIWITNDAEPKLFLTTGDAANQPSAQQTASLNGKVLRLNPDGTIPPDNPIAGNPLWSYGHRNAQGLVMANNIMYASEHGPSEEDEVNIIEKGRNYGWPDVKGPCNGGELSFCTTNNVKEPIWSSGGSTIAVCGLDYYDHDRIPQWKNSLLMTTLKNSSLRQLKLSADGQSVTETAIFLKDEYGRLRDVCISPEGRVYVCTSNGSDDKIIEISSLP
ncbi:PQQ-dependent sugar dehydrogenase [Foetidibacter luteolus]|uniref:PQQ-dependent sugar dehydrogenase n=1 Tax=Foetidibacter luteolus TaxID=2608880 RepID=UPI00129BFB6C|nr:PQQ-dependent sugar dehydrogenase [Foetidibacter luteolus]